MKIETTAVLFVDSLKGFTYICPDELPVPDAENIVPELLAMLPFGKYKLASAEDHLEDALYHADEEHPQFSPAPSGKDMDIRWNKHCVKGTKGAELLDVLPDRSEYEYFVAKGIKGVK